MNLSNVIWTDIEQNSEDWLGLRAGKITSSKIGAIMANYGKSFGEPAKKLAVTIAAERVTGKKSQLDSFSNVYTMNGHAYETVAKDEYESINFCRIKDGGFFYSDTLGDSPDGLIGDSKVVEIKSQILTEHFKLLEKGGYPSKYKWQIQWHLLLTGRPVCEFISYCYEDHCPEDKRLYSVSIGPDEELIEMIKARVHEFETKLVEKNILTLKKH